MGQLTALWDLRLGKEGINDGRREAKGVYMCCMSVWGGRAYMGALVLGKGESFHWGIKNNGSGEGWGSRGSCGTSSFVREGVFVSMWG